MAALFLISIKNEQIFKTAWNATNDLENIWQYDWHIDTKYYTADIQLCCTTGRTIGNKEFKGIIHMFKRLQCYIWHYFILSNNQTNSWKSNSEIYFFLSKSH
jgi:hypothetical protein